MDTSIEKRKLIMQTAKLNEELIEYKQYLEGIVKTGDSKIFTNGGVEHASILMSILFDNTKSYIKMYCRGLSPELTTREEYFNSFSAFLDSGKNIQLLIETDEYISDKAFTKLLETKKRWKNDGRIEIKQITEASKKNIRTFLSMDDCNFAIFDNDKFRLEMSPTTYQAIGSFNNPKIASNLGFLFDYAFSKGTELNVPM